MDSISVYNWKSLNSMEAERSPSGSKKLGMDNYIPWNGDTTTIIEEKKANFFCSMICKESLLILDAIEDVSEIKQFYFAGANFNLMITFLQYI